MKFNSGIDLQKDPLFDFLYEWADLILNQERSLNIKIMESHTKDPQAEQDDVFLVIKYAPVTTKIGNEIRTIVNDDGKRDIINDYDKTMEIWEVNGTGQVLQILLNSIGRQDITDLWKKNGYAYRSQGNINPIPNTQENRWKRQSLIELTIGTAQAIEEKTGTIDSVGIEGTIPAQGRAGEHTI